MTDKDRDLWLAAMRDVTPLAGRGRVVPPPPRAIPRPNPPSPPSGVLDAHGLTVQQAHDATHRLLDHAHRAGRKSVVVVTGRSGAIRREFPGWLDGNPAIGRIEELNGGGAYRLHLKRPRKGR